MSIVLSSTKPVTVRVPKAKPQAKSAKRRRRRVTAVPRSLRSQGDLANAYFRCLVDPFNSAPIRAGFGCMVQTQVHTAYYRGSFQTNSTDGSWSFFALPNPNNFLSYNISLYNANPTGATCTLGAAANTILLNTMVDQGRTLAMGVRFYPMIPMTSPPGIISLGCGPRSDLTDFVASSSTASAGNGIMNQPTSTVLQLPYLRQHIGRTANADYYQVCWRPTDVKDFQFHPQDSPVIGFNSAATTTSPYYVYKYGTGNNPVDIDTQGSVLVAASQSMPLSTTIFYEVVLHFEAVNTTNSIANIEATVSNPSSDCVAGEGQFSSMESLYRAFMNRLPSADTVAGATISVMTSPAVQRAALGYAQRRLFAQADGYQMIAV